MIDSIKKRRSIRKYQDRPVEDEKIKEILRAAMYSPSANHIQPWEFIIIKEPEVKQRLSEATSWSYFAAEAPVVIVICTVEGRSKEWIEDCSIVAEHIWLEATNQDLGTCWIQIHNSPREGSREHEEYVKSVLNCPDNVRILCLLPIGYPAEDKSEHKEGEFDEDKIHEEEW